MQLYRDGKRVLECLQRALRVADACMDAAVSVELFVEILNRYVYYFDQENDAVSLPTFHILCTLLISHRSQPSTSTASLNSFTLTCNPMKTHPVLRTHGNTSSAPLIT